MLRSSKASACSLFVLDSVTLLWYFLLRLSEVGQREVIRVAGGSFDRLRTGPPKRAAPAFLSLGPFDKLRVSGALGRLRMSGEK
jgi:hypothetical protein